jgi:signal transduction histidine kinase
LDNSELRFTVDSLLLGEIGERLVTRNYIALAELVKNAYDADSTTLSVEFINATGDDPSQKSKIVVIDNGHGMTFEQIREFWMRIATPNKIDVKITPYYGRIKTGSKGIGRFACARLSSQLVLETVAKSSVDNCFERTRVNFAWDDYVPGTTLTEIPNKYTTETIPNSKTYTKLELVSLREPWTAKEFNVLRRQILGLAMVYPTKRKGYHEDPGFTIAIVAPEFKKGTQLLSEQVMDAGWGRLKGSVSEDGTVTLTLEAMKVGEPTFVLSERFNQIPLVSFDIAIIQRIKEYCRDESTLALYSIDEIFENWSGVKVFLDGFRVYPYGDPGNDWLGIDEQQARRLGKINPIFERLCRSLRVDESRALLNQPRNQNLVGRVFLSNQPRRIFDVPINREGFIENEASKQLKDLVVKAIIWATVYYNHFLYLRTKEEMQKVEKSFIKELPATEGKQPEEIQVLDSAIGVLNEAYKDYKNKVPSEERTIAGKYFEKAIAVVKETTAYASQQLTTLRTVASTGALMYVFSHEIHDLLSRLGTISNKMDIVASTVPEDQRPELLKLSLLVKATHRRLLDQMRLFSGVSMNLADMKKHRIDLFTLAEEVIGCHDFLANEFSIKIDNKIPKNLRTGPMLEAEVYSILLNLVSNAVKATIAGHGNSIELEASARDHEILLRVYDDGIGLSESAKDKVFTALVADPDNRLYPELSKRLGEEEMLSVGQGSGLGLSIISDILKSYGKTIRFLRDSEIQRSWKTCVEVTLPL